MIESRKQWTADEIILFLKKEKSILLDSYMVREGRQRTRRRIVTKDSSGYLYDTDFSHYIKGKKSKVGKKNPFSLERINGVMNEEE